LHFFWTAFVLIPIFYYISAVFPMGGLNF